MFKDFRARSRTQDPKVVAMPKPDMAPPPPLVEVDSDHRHRFSRERAVIIFFVGPIHRN